MLLDLKGKTYPVEFVSDVSISMCMMMGLIKSSSCTQGQTKAKRNKKDILTKAKASQHVRMLL